VVGEGADDADTKVSSDNELDDLRTRAPAPFSPPIDETGGANIKDIPLWRCFIGLVSSGVPDLGTVSNGFITIL
jgi:hypothetical protein